MSGRIEVRRDPALLSRLCGEDALVNEKPNPCSSETSRTYGVFSGASALRYHQL